MDDTALLQAIGLTREFKGYKAVEDISIQLNQGEILGLLGPNGAGKSTTMQMLTGNLVPTIGQITVKGIDLLDFPKSAKQHIGYLPETPPLYRDLTVLEYLNYCAELRSLDKKRRLNFINKALERCYLTDVKSRLINNLSKGYRQRVGIAQAILHEPAIVILDEPTVGLDPIQIREIRNLIKELGENHAVMLSTHILPEVQAVCDRVQIIHQGKSVFNQPLVELNTQLQTRTILSSDKLLPLEALENLPQIESVKFKDNNIYEFQHSQGINIVPMLMDFCVKNNIEPNAIYPVHNSLEQIFMSLVHQEAEVTQEKS
ncbi:MAG: hypothetical protein RLZZ422_1753 [Pseudomonadota bacterium]|jgi:ABC-2 type transport system ATP-binding protein